MKLFPNCILKRLLYIAIIVLINHHLALSQQSISPPITRDELIDLCQRPSLKDHPEWVLRDFVQRFKISFLPTKQQRDFLRANNVPDTIVNNLKNNFACRLIYRVCHFEPINNNNTEEFTNILKNVLETERLSMQAKINGILKDKIFDPIIAGPTGPDTLELQQHPNSGYLLIMGDMRNIPNSSNKMLVTARLVFVSKVQERMSIASIEKTIDNSVNSKKNIAKEISRWSIEELERQVK